MVKTRILQEVAGEVRCWKPQCRRLAKFVLQVGNRRVLYCKPCADETLQASADQDET